MEQTYNDALAKGVSQASGTTIAKLAERKLGAYKDVVTDSAASRNSAKGQAPSTVLPFGKMK